MRWFLVGLLWVAATPVWGQGIVEGKPCILDAPPLVGRGRWAPSGPATIGPRPLILVVPSPQVGGAGQAPVVGALILDVLENSPAKRARLEPGDRIVAINGEPIQNSADYYRLIEARPRAALSIVDGRSRQPRRRVITPEAGRIGVEFVVR